MADHCRRSCRLTPALHLYPTVEACATIICKFNLSAWWLYFRVLAACYAISVFAFSLYYFYIIGALNFYPAFFTNWLISLQMLYFTFSAIITVRIYRVIAPKRVTKRQNSSNKDKTERPGVLRQTSSYDMVGRPLKLSRLGLKSLFFITKSMLEFCLPFSLFVVGVYWTLIFQCCSFSSMESAIYYINTHGIVTVLQFVDAYGSTYQLRYHWGVFWLLLFGVIGATWMLWFERMALVNPFTDESVLYAPLNWHRDGVNAVILWTAGIVALIVCYLMIVWTKNLALIKWRLSDSLSGQLSLRGDNVDNAVENIDL